MHLLYFLLQLLKLFLWQMQTLSINIKVSFIVRGDRLTANLNTLNRHPPITLQGLLDCLISQIQILLIKLFINSQVQFLVP